MNYRAINRAIKCIYNDYTFSLWKFQAKSAHTFLIPSSRCVWADSYRVGKKCKMKRWFSVIGFQFSVEKKCEIIQSTSLPVYRSGKMQDELVVSQLIFSI